jgi:hypothetical protein
VLPTLEILTLNKSHRFTDKLAGTDAQQFVGFGPVTVAMIPVAVELTPQFVLLYISALTD